MSRQCPVIKKEVFLRTYSDVGSVERAAKAAKINRRTHSRWLKADAKYRTSFKEAKQAFIERLEVEAHRRAVDGVQRQQFYQGEPIYVPCQAHDEGAVAIKGDDGKVTWHRPYIERLYSDVLLMFLLKRLDRRYRDCFTMTPKQRRQPDREPRPSKSIYESIRKRLMRESRK